MDGPLIQHLEGFRYDGDEEPASLGGRLSIRARHLGSQPVLRARTALGGWGTLSYAELDDRSDRLARGLLASGLEPGAPVAFLFSNDAGIEAVVSYSAIHKAGAVAIPINARFVAREIAQIIEHSSIGTLLYEHVFAETVAEAADRAPGDVRLVQAGGSAPSHARSWHELVESGGASGTLPRVGPSDMADWLYTSGTTGVPKCAMLTHENCLFAGESLAACFRLERGDVHLTASPFYTSSGCHTSLLSSITAGATYVMSPSPRAEVLLDLIDAEDATVVGAVPSVFAYMCESERLAPDQLRDVKLVYHGGSAVTASVVGEIQKAFPAAEVINVYGQTESGNPGTVLRGEWSVEKAGSIGREGMPGVDVQLVDDQGGVVGADGLGEICLRSPAVMQGYLHNPEETGNVLRDGWLYTGDLARIDADGFMFIYDRKKDLIIRGGHNIASIEVEDVINSHPQVIESAVVGKPHQSLGEDLKAYVVLVPSVPIEPEELRAFCGARLADYKVPRDFSFVDELPRNPTGKVLKRELRERARREARNHTATGIR